MDPQPSENLHAPAGKELFNLTGSFIITGAAPKEPWLDGARPISTLSSRSSKDSRKGLLAIFLPVFYNYKLETAPVFRFRFFRKEFLCIDN
jgi:hypothetical protein